MLSRVKAFSTRRIQLSMLCESNGGSVGRRICCWAAVCCEAAAVTAAWMMEALLSLLVSEQAWTAAATIALRASVSMVIVMFEGGNWNLASAP